MTDLRDRFQGLDQIKAPDLWLEATQRAAQPAPARGFPSVDGFLPLARRGFLLVTVIAVVVATGAAASWWWLSASGTPVADAPPLEWTGPVRVQHGAPATVQATAAGPRAEDRDGPIPLWSWDEDGKDATPQWINITSVQFSNEPGELVTWYVPLEAFPPRTETLNPAQTVISYGLVLDTNADGIADYELGMSNEAATPGDLRLWITDLANGEIDEHVGRPNGFPYEEWHPDQRLSDDEARQPRFTFAESKLAGLDSASVRFYAWSSMTNGTEVVAWDYAPDAAWVVLPPDIGP